MGKLQKNTSFSFTCLITWSYKYQTILLYLRKYREMKEKHWYECMIGNVNGGMSNISYCYFVEHLLKKIYLDILNAFSVLFINIGMFIFLLNLMGNIKFQVIDFYPRQGDIMNVKNIHPTCLTDNVMSMMCYVHFASNNINKYCTSTTCIHSLYLWHSSIHSRNPESSIT